MKSVRKTETYEMLEGGKAGKQVRTLVINDENRNDKDTFFAALPKRSEFNHY